MKVTFAVPLLGSLSLHLGFAGTKPAPKVRVSKSGVDNRKRKSKPSYLMPSGPLSIASASDGCLPALEAKRRELLSQARPPRASAVDRSFYEDGGDEGDFEIIDDDHHD